MELELSVLEAQESWCDCYILPICHQRFFLELSWRCQHDFMTGLVIERRVTWFQIGGSTVYRPVLLRQLVGRGQASLVRRRRARLVSTLRSGLVSLSTWLDGTWRDYHLTSTCLALEGCFKSDIWDRHWRHVICHVTDSDVTWLTLTPPTKHVTLGLTPRDYTDWHQLYVDGQTFWAVWNDQGD